MLRFRIVKSIRRRRDVLMLLLLSAIVIYILGSITVFARIETTSTIASIKPAAKTKSRGFWSFPWPTKKSKRTGQQKADAEDSEVRIHETPFNITPTSRGVQDFWYAKVNAEWAYWPSLGYCRGNKSQIEDIDDDVCFRRSCLFSKQMQTYVNLDAVVDHPAAGGSLLPPLRWAGELRECRQPKGGQLATAASKTSPQVSLIFILHDHADMSAQALLEVFRTSLEAYSVELVLVDDASREDMSAVHSLLQSLQYMFDLAVVTIRHERRLGYLNSLEIAVQHAKGEYVVWMHRDILPLPGWLKLLLHSIKRYREDEGVVMVAPLILDGMGRVKEAGAALFANQQIVPMAKGAFPSELLLQHARFVDVLSARCLLIKRSFLSTMKLELNLDYEGVGEDVYVRPAASWKLLLQPLAVVVAARDDALQPSEDTQLLSLIPKVQSEMLPEAVLCPAPSSVSLQADMAYAFYRQSNRVLVLEDLVPETDRESGAIRLWELLHLLVELNYSVSFEALSARNREVKYILPLLARGMNVMTPGSLHALANHVRDNHVFQGLDGSLQQQLCPWDVIIMARRLILDNHWNDVHLLCPHVGIIFDTIDLHFIRELRMFGVKYHLTDEELTVEQAHVNATLAMRKLQKGKSKPKKAKDKARDKRESELAYIIEARTRELQYVQQSNITLVVSKDEQTLIHDLLGNDFDVRVISNIYQIDEEEQIPGAEERSGAIFVGNMCHLPNLDAVDFIMTSILKGRNVFPSRFRIHFVWSRSRICNHLILEEAEKHPLVIVHRDISNVELLQLHQQVKMVLAPLRYGAGVKGKVNYALLHGVPVIATRMASEGMGLSNEVNFLLAETGDDFIKQILRLQGDADLHQRLSQNGKALMRELFSREVAREKLQQALHDLGMPVHTAPVFQCPKLALYEQQVVTGWEEFWQWNSAQSRWSRQPPRLSFPLFAGLPYDQPAYLRSLASSS